jgi:hypothetical protein
MPTEISRTRIRDSPIVKALMAMRRRLVRWIGAALTAVSNSSNVQFSWLGMLCFRDMPLFNHIPIKKSRSFSRLFPRIAI